MSLPDVIISRTNGQLGRVQPTIDNVFGLVISGVAVAGKIALLQPVLLTSIADLTTYGLVTATNPLAVHVITKFYAQAEPGTELYLILYSDATMLNDVCDKTTGAVKTLVDFADGRIRGVFIHKKMPGGYTPTITTGLDADVIAAQTKLQAFCVEQGAANNPLFAVIPGFGFTKAAIAALADQSQNTANQVAILLAADDATGIAAIGTLAGWMAKHAVHQNIGRVAHGAVLNLAWLVDGSTAKEVKNSWAILHDKRYIFFRQYNQKSGFFFNDDPTTCPVSDDFSSLSWNRIINKAHVLAYGVLVDRLNDDVPTNETTGGIAPSVCSDWEGAVENAIQTAMVNEGQVSAVECLVDPGQDVVATDKVVASIRVVRNGQSKTIQVDIGYTPSV